MLQNKAVKYSKKSPDAVDSKRTDVWETAASEAHNDIKDENRFRVINHM